ncbi:MAG: agmatine deiminase family protein, partial [Solirubrobacterales bacterium]
MSATLKSTPAADGFRMPGEFEPHSGCWMVWPERPDNWRLGAKPAQEAFAAVAAAISTSEPVTMAVSDAQFE